MLILCIGDNYQAWFEYKRLQGAFKGKKQAYENQSNPNQQDLFGERTLFVGRNVFGKIKNHGELINSGDVFLFYEKIVKAIPSGAKVYDYSQPSKEDITDLLVSLALKYGVSGTETARLYKQTPDFWYLETELQKLSVYC